MCFRKPAGWLTGISAANSRWSRLWRHIPAPAYVAAGALGATVCWCVALVL
ncbi:MAG: hypothetical protein ACLT5P_03270 [Flavonifractor plautii]